MDAVSGLLVIPCPACTVPAEVTDRFWLPSTDGPVLMLAVRCLNEHHFRMPVDDATDPHAWHTALAASYPAYEFERLAGSRPKWCAKALRLGVHPWCVVTGDPREFGRHLPLA